MLTLKEREELYDIFDSNYEENEKFFNKIKKNFIKNYYGYVHWIYNFKLILNNVLL